MHPFIRIDTGFIPPEIPASKPRISSFRRPIYRYLRLGDDAAISLGNFVLHSIYYNNVFMLALYSTRRAQAYDESISFALYPHLLRVLAHKFSVEIFEKTQRTQHGFTFI